MADFDLDNYVPVHERVAKFWVDHGNGSIQTEAAFPDERTVRVRAVVFSDKADTRPAATGHAEEVRMGEVNSVSALENCETSAIGRALALMGYEIDRGMASRSEMEKVQRHREAPSPVAPDVMPQDVAKLTIDPAKAKDLLKKIQKSGIEAPAIKLQLRATEAEIKGSMQETLAALTPKQATLLEEFIDDTPPS